ncbi:MAG: energy transducer TonB [Alphaproteobacteria bacterium]
MKRIIILTALISLGATACATKKTFMPQSQYPPDPWVKGYSDPDDCLGGEKLAAIDFDLPDYPRRAFNTGRQGWVIVRLDVSETGETENVDVERAVPDVGFAGNARSAAEKWRFEPPKDGALQACRVLIRYRFGTVSIGG